MKLIYATVFDSSDIRNWSGLGVYYCRMLRDSGFPDVLSLNVREKPFPGSLISLLKAKLGARLGQKDHPIFNKEEASRFGQVMQRRAAGATHVITPNSILFSNDNNGFKKILYTDSTLDNLLNFYGNYFHLDEGAVQEAQELEQQAIDQSDLLIYTSQWAADSAINYYKADPRKVSVIPFGANLSSIPDAIQLQQIVEKRDLAKRVNLLFLGVDWERKGGAYAVEVLQQLEALGIPATLHLAGLPALPPGLNTKNIVHHGFISKRSGTNEARLSRLIAGSDFLLLPSLADCTPVAFSEANAFGVPCLASRVGGHESIIKDGINGKTFSHTDYVKESVDYISALVEDPGAYRQLCYASYNEYATELNWKSTGEKIAKLIKSL